jgi:phospho-N-acetylmuramoyl-pentapeptide-transferase
MPDKQKILTQIFLILGSEFFAFLIAIIITPFFIKFLYAKKIGKQIRNTAASGEKASLYHKLHSTKTGTPTMGGIVIWGTTLVVLLFSHGLYLMGLIDRSLINRQETYLPIFTLITAATLGAVDDYFNIKGLGQSKGINIKPKMFWLLLLSTLGAFWFYEKLEYDTIFIPFLGSLEIGWLYIPLFILVIVSTANAVNFTDGLDGLAGGLAVIAFTAFGIIAYMKSLIILSAFCAIIAGATLAFVWHNVPPAKFFMGDTGALALGATLGVIAMLTDSVAVLPIIGFVFVIETLSIIIQLCSKKLFNRKVFAIAPLHHHFEHQGISEHTVVMRFWIVGAISAGLGVILFLLGKL